MKSTFVGIERKLSSDGSNINFTISKSQEYTDLNENFLHLECRDCRNRTSVSGIIRTRCPVNNLGHSLFWTSKFPSEVSKCLTAKPTPQSLPEALLNYDEIKRGIITRLKSADTAGKFNAQRT